MIYRYGKRAYRLIVEYVLEQLIAGAVRYGMVNRTDKRPVRMEYIDEIDIPEFREIPTYKRMCVCILKNDHTCKYMGFTQTKREREMKERVLKRYKL